MGQSKLPDTGPEIANLFPAGGQSGKTFEILFRGRRLDQVTEVEFSHRGIAAEICRAGFRELAVVVSVDGNVPSGVHDFRVTGTHGSYVGVIHITNLPDVKEAEPNNLPANAHKPTLPMVVNGVIDNNDVDLYSFAAEPGDAILIQVLGRVLSAGIDSQITILDSNGNEVEFQDDDGSERDSRLVFRPKKKDQYVLQVGHAFPFGGPFNYYRLTVGKLPNVSDVFPVALQRGTTAEVALTGDNLDQLHSVKLGKAEIAGTFVERTGTSAKVRFELPADLAEGFAAMRFATEKTDSLSEIPVLITRVRESASTSARSRTAPEKLAIPAGVSGRMEGKRPTHFYEIIGRGGETVNIKVQSTDLRSSMDPVLSLFDAQGKLLVFQDEPIPWYFTERPASDVNLNYRFEKDGSYVLAVRDAGHGGGPEYLYHLSVERAQPDFRIRLNKPSFTLYRGKKSTLSVRVQREHGWDTPVEVWAEVGKASQLLRVNGVAEPKNSTVADCDAKRWEVNGTDVELEIEVPAGAEAGDVPVRIYGRGKDKQGREVTHLVSGIYYSGFNGPFLGDMQFADPNVSIANLPALIPETPFAVAVTAGKTEKLTVNVNRYENADTKLPVRVENLPEGVTVAEAELGPNAGIVELKVVAAKEAKPGKRFIQVRVGEAVAPDIELTVNPAPEKKK